MAEDVQWIFFDLGSTLIDESDCYRKRYAEMVDAARITIEEFEDKVIEFAKQNRKGDHEAAQYYGLMLPKWHEELEKLYPDVPDLLSSLVERGYKLGIIANQRLGASQRMSRWNILNYFEVIKTSAEEGIEKPDAEIFIRALKAAGCASKNAVMVGDRLDNDIVPAKRLGMKTIWIRQGMAVHSMPHMAAEKADYAVDNIGELKRLFDSVALR